MSNQQKSRRDRPCDRSRRQAYFDLAATATVAAAATVVGVVVTAAVVVTAVVFQKQQDADDEQDPRPGAIIPTEQIRQTHNHILL